MSWAVFEITDGSTTVNLLDPRNGFVLASWEPTRPTPKGGGVWADSQLVRGRTLVDSVYSNPVDTATFHLTGRSQNFVRQRGRDLDDLIVKAMTASTTPEVQQSPVYIKVKAKRETDYSYAEIFMVTRPSDGNPFQQPFFGNCDKATFRDVSINFERSTWMEAPPTTATAHPLKVATVFNNEQFGFSDTNIDLPYIFTVVDGKPSPLTLGGKINVDISGEGVLTGDATYFGHDYRFQGMILNLERGVGGSVSGVWEYWTGSTWQSFTPTTDDTNGLAVSGTDMDFTMPEAVYTTGWAAKDLSAEGVSAAPSAFWIRRRWTGGIGAPNAAHVYIEPVQVRYIPDYSSANLPVITNYRQNTNITHVLRDNGVSFTYLNNEFPQELFNGTNPCYFGVDSTISGAHGFFNLVFNLTGGTAGNTITWEFYNGATWVTINPTVVDNTSAFSEDGFVTVLWEGFQNWGTVSPDGVVTGYFVRATPSASFTSAPEINGPVYSATAPFVELDTVPGDISGPVQMYLKNLSSADTGGYYDGITRIVMGIKGLDRAQGFQSHINLTSAENKSGITISLGANTSYVADTRNTAFEYANFNPSGVTGMADRATITINSNLADWHGRYRVFAVYQNGTGAASFFDGRIRIKNGSLGTDYYTDTKFVLQYISGQPAMADFGKIFLDCKNADQVEIAFQLSCSIFTTVANMALRKIVLIPADEWIGDFFTGDWSDDFLQDKRFYVDSISDRREGIFADIRNDSTLKREAKKISIASNDYPLRPGRSRIYFLFGGDLGIARGEYLTYRRSSACAVSIARNAMFSSMIGDA